MTKINKQKVLYEKEDDILNIWLSKSPVDYAQESDGVIVHFSKKNEPVYIEVLEASRFLKETTKSLPNKIQKQIWASV
jgi:hypothetical protein